MPRKNLVILSYAFAPSIGGIETVSLELARVFSRRNYDVTVITQTIGGLDQDTEPFRILRRPGSLKLLREIKRADVVVQSNISLNLGWPLWTIFCRKPFVLVFHGTITRPEGQLAWQDRLKRSLLWRPYYLSVSRYLAEQISPGSRVIHNPYNNSAFRLIPGTSRDGDLLFVGRLVPAKGVDILLRAFAKILQLRPQTTLSIVGSGTEEAVLRDLAESLGLANRVKFLGPMQGKALAEVMNQFKILVVPSRARPPEACPVVPVEGIACGCVPVVSRMGGLPESVGDAGLLFEEENPDELASATLRLLSSPDLLDFYRARGAEHIKRFHPESVADEYEFHFAAVSGGKVAESSVTHPVSKGELT